jgi:hypothetical protein
MGASQTTRMVERIQPRCADVKNKLAILVNLFFKKFKIRTSGTPVLYCYENILNMNFYNSNHLFLTKIFPSLKYFPMTGIR